MNQPSPAIRRTWIDRFLNVVEKGGNALPHPATLFAILALVVILLSWITSQFALVVQHPVSGEEIRPVNLVSIAGLHRILTGLITNFTGFAPLGTVLVSLIGIGVAEHSGLIGAALRKLILSAPRFLLTPIVVFAGVMSNMASEIGYVLLVPLAGLIFKAAGRHPILGMAAGFAGVSGGYSANLLLGTIDPLLAGLSQEAARILDPAYTVNPAANWYFMIVSTPLIAILGTFVTEKIIAPRFPDENPQPAPLSEKFKWVLHLLIVVGAPAAVHQFYIAGRDGVVPWVVGFGIMLFLIVALVVVNTRLFERYGSQRAGDDDIAGDSSEIDPMSAAEHRGLVYAIIATLALTALVLWGTVPADGFLRDPDTGDLLNSPFLKGIVALIFAYGVIAGVAYGIGAGTIKSDEDVIRGMGQSMSTLGGYLVLTFFAAQFVAFFNWTQLGLIFAVEGASFLQAINMPAIPLFMSFILLTAAANLFMGSASAKWALMAPVFVPMFMILGYSPEITQLGYRIGDSVTNIISPMMSYFALIIAFLQRYEPKAGIGTVIAVMLPYSIVFGIGWSILFAFWLSFGLPIGPGAPLQYIPAMPGG
jgi:aminobenzoyl-glutamate transport protein